MAMPDNEEQGGSKILEGAREFEGALEEAAPPVKWVRQAAEAGFNMGTGIVEATGIDDTLSDGLLGLVGEEESYKAAQAFDEGEYLEGVGHMASGAYDTVSDAASDAYDTVADAASDALDYLNPFD
jgi:hypothetical protein